MRPLFPSPPPPSPMPRDPDRAVLVRRALQDRLLETLRYLADEIEVRRVGGLGEAQATGYVAGRLQRAEQQATVMSFRTPTARIGAMIAAIILGCRRKPTASTPATAHRRWRCLSVVVHCGDPVLG